MTSGLARHPTLGTPAPATASTALGMKPLRTFEVDTYGNVRTSIGQSGAARPCTTFDFEGPFTQFPERVRQYAGSSCTGTSLTTSLIFDRGLGALAAASYPNNTMRTSEYDAFGRLSAVYAPAPDQGPFATALATQITHHTQSPVSWTEISRRSDIDAYVTSIEIFNGVGEPVLGFDQADALADGAPWIARSWTERDTSGRPTSTLRPWFFSGDPYAVAASAPALPALGSRLSVMHDEFGRPTFAYDGAVNTAQLTYLPLQTSVQDAEQVSAGSPFTGLRSTRKVDGHGRAIETKTPAGNGNTTTTRTTYLGTGEPTQIERSGNADPQPYVRTIEWDSFGRMITNAEPNTSVGGAAWNYVYDDEGRLVGTSDARQCGKNFDYDALGRLRSEDFSPCLPEQAAYTAPNLATGDGTETFNVYDAYEPGQVAPTPSFADNPSLGVGQLVATYDRGAVTRFNYDGRGRARRVTRRMAKPGAPDAALATRYASHWFKQEAGLDLGDRLRKRTTGLEQVELTGGGPSFETMTYSARGALRQIGSSYGDLVSQLGYSASGNPLHAQYGDLAATETAIGYDSRERLAALRVRRGASPALWTASPPPAGYTLPGSDTTELTLTDLAFTRDAVGNPLTINDSSTGTWPSGSRPVSRAMAYDSAYRIQRVDYAHGGDAFQPYYFAEALAGDRRPIAESVANARTAFQTFATDAQGNVTSADDDVGLRFDRSLGTVHNGIGVDASVHGPNQLIDADGMHASYDAAGNLVELTVALYLLVADAVVLASIRLRLGRGGAAGAGAPLGFPSGRGALVRSERGAGVGPELRVRRGRTDAHHEEGSPRRHRVPHARRVRVAAPRACGVRRGDHRLLPGRGRERGGLRGRRGARLLRP